MIKIIKKQIIVEGKSPIRFELARTGVNYVDRATAKAIHLTYVQHDLTFFTIYMYVY